MKKILSLSLVFCLICSCFVGCGVGAKDPVPDTGLPTEVVTKPVEEPTVDPIVETPDETEETETPDTPAVSLVKPVGFENWQSEWIAFSPRTNEENILLSPVSLKMACLLAAAGADGDTQAQILNMYGYDNLDDFLAWGEYIIGIQESLAEVETTPEDSDGNIWYSTPVGSRGTFKIANGIWHNAQEPGEFTGDYKERVSRLQAAIDTLPSTELKDAINNWANEATNGLIPKVVGDEVELSNNILANALYLKASWLNEFDKDFIEEDFTTKSGEIVKKTMMTQCTRMRYYADDYSSMVLLPMSDGFYMAVVKGDASEIEKKIDSAEPKLINLKMPKFEITHKSTDIVDMMQHLGVVDAFTPNKANFSQMMDVATFISNIAQDSKIVVDEKGIEAAAVTVVHMMTSGLVTEAPVPIDFFVDEAFAFYIYHESYDDAGAIHRELMFYGECNK